MPRKCNVSLAQWVEATERYELGYVHANHLARELGVSPQTVMREMRKRGAIKGSRASETITELVAELDRKALHRAHLQAAADRLAVDRLMASLSILDNMMAALQQAERDGDVTLARDVIDITGPAFGYGVSRRSVRSNRM